ncbi:Os10g0502450 [Oryza sativa Japonica Group]|uniref:Os10g0502450 protein n=1 Tax=Oryza sativa subsp. japonica TaxID=39947 RepID=A0A0P0XWD9_ORYSJ|nr:hypothetical protein EE612_052163 [Oryza sativa]BAT11539.1 Os10g0502450 [Oryza sativa Japonica Group]
MIVWASIAFLSRSSLLASTTSFKSSTLYTRAWPTSDTQALTFLGTDMSTKSRTPPIASEIAGSASACSFVNNGVSDAVLVNTTSASAAASYISVRGLYTISMSFISSRMASTLSTERFTTTTFLHPLAIKCLTTNFPILPAPINSILADRHSDFGSFIKANSTAAELTETAPDDMLVSQRTRFPAVIASLNILSMFFPKPPLFCPLLTTCLT